MTKTFFVMILCSVEILWCAHLFNDDSGKTPADSVLFTHLA